MMIIGCDFHPSFQQIAYVNKETGEYGERRLTHRAEAQAFYRALAGSQVRVGMEATGNFRWFRRLLGELGHEGAGRPLQPAHALVVCMQVPRKKRSCTLRAKFIDHALVVARVLR
jgi:hypothetical protein